MYVDSYPHAHKDLYVRVGVYVYTHLVVWNESNQHYLLFSDDEFGERTVSILLDGEESEMIFIDHPSTEMSVSKSPP